MTTSPTHEAPELHNTDGPQVPQAYRTFFDDAATFPPGRAPLREAVAAYLQRRRTPLVDSVGPAVLAIADVPKAAEIAKEIDDQAEPIPVSTVVPIGGLEDARQTAKRVPAGVRVVSYELKTDDDEDLEDLAFRAGELAQEAGVAVWLELRTGRIDQKSMQLLATHGLGLKFRTGGLAKELFPSSEELAYVIVAAVEAAVPFKLTAGLHEAVRFTAETSGFEHHGFLNIAAATAAAQSGASRAAVAELLSSEDPRQLIATVREGAWRDSFASFGTCSIIEPVESLQQLKLVSKDLLPANDAAEKE